MKIEAIVNYQTSENTYVVYDEESKNGVVIDPGIDAKRIMDFCRGEGICVKLILITHCHYDHISGLVELMRLSKARLAAGKYGSINVGNPDINLTEVGLGYPIQGFYADITVKDGEKISAGTLEFECIYTPGHTNCGVCWKIDNVLFSGDTLFRQNCGRWDLPTGNGDTLLRSIRERLFTLDDNITVYPGHGGKTTIGYEKKFNLVVSLPQ